MPAVSNIDRSNFGIRLKEAREAAGYDIDTLARRLHIRSDIVRAIESSNFKDMPASGYAKNMIRSYARTVGLNQNEISELYLREYRLYERSKNLGERAEMQNVNSKLAGSRSRRSNTRVSSRSRQSRELPHRETRQNRPFSTRGSRTQKTTQSMSSTFGLGRMPKPSVPSFDANNIVKIVIVAVIVVLVIVICMTLFGGNKQKSEEVPTMPISGLTDTSNQASTDNSTNSTTKTKATFQFSIESGNQSYCTVTLDGTQEYAEVAQGPTTKTYDVTGTITFATANPGPVSAKLDNEEVELVADSSTGYYTYTYDFAANNTNSNQSANSTSSTSSSSTSTSTSSSSSSSNSTSSSANNSSSTSSSSSSQY